MEAKDLRLGNLISDIHASSSFYAEIKKITQDRVYYGSFNSHPNNLKPIQLNEEWLFKICRYKFSIKDRWEVEIQGELFVLFVNDIDNTFHIEFTGGEGVSFSKPIKYVHQLQNLFFALTNQELEIKM